MEKRIRLIIKMKNIDQAKAFKKHLNKEHRKLTKGKTCIVKLKRRGLYERIQKQ